METIIRAFGKEFCYQENKGVEFNPEKNKTQAYKTMQELESMIGGIGFDCVESRGMSHWDKSKFVKVTDNSGRTLELSTYFDIVPDSNVSQTVKYDIKGLEADVKQATSDLGVGYVHQVA